MDIDWAAFSPSSALAGGAMIGIAATFLALANGRIAGISGILGGLLRPSLPELAWRAAFIAGLIAAPVLYRFVSAAPEVVIDASVPLLLVAGFAVGIGTRYASGCTSGHGVCGVARLSMRSIVATCAFTLAAMATVFATRHLSGL